MTTWPVLGDGQGIYISGKWWGEAPTHFRTVIPSQGPVFRQRELGLDLTHQKNVTYSLALIVPPYKGTLRSPDLGSSNSLE